MFGWMRRDGPSPVDIQLPSGKLRANPSGWLVAVNMSLFISFMRCGTRQNQSAKNDANHELAAFGARYTGGAALLP